MRHVCASKLFLLLTAVTKPPSSYNIAPCDKHSNSVTKTTPVTTHFLVEPNLRGGFQDFHQRVAQLCYRQPNPVRLCLRTTRSSQNSKLTSWHFRQRMTEPLLALWNSAKAKFFQFGSWCLFHLQHPTHCHHKTTIILQHCTMWQTRNFRHNPILPHRTCMRGAKTSSNRARSSPTASHLLSGPRPTFRACAILRSSITEMFARASWSHSRPLVTALLRSSCNRISTPSDDKDDAVACSIRTDIPFSKWNSDHKIVRYNDSRSIFCPLLMHFNENITYIFFVLYLHRSTAS